MTAILSDPEAVILLTGILLSIAAALPGSFLVLRGSSLLTDAISHAAVFGIAVTWLVTGVISGPIQVIGAALSGVVTIFLIEGLVQSGRIRQDAAMGLVFPTLFATGVLIINLYGRQLHLDIDTVLLGEIAFVWLDTQSLFGLEVPQALVMLGACALINALYVLAFWKELKLATFDPDFAALQGMRPGMVIAGLLTLTSATAVAALDAVGVILFVAFVIVPAATAYLLTHRLAAMVPLAVLIGVCGTFLGKSAAFALDVSIGGMMALVTVFLFKLALLFAPRRGVLAALLRRREARIDFATRTMLSHLYSHRDGPEMAVESEAAALREHLRWPAAQVERVILRGLDQGMITREGERLALTPLGAAKAEEALHQMTPKGSLPEGH